MELIKINSEKDQKLFRAVISQFKNLKELSVRNSSINFLPDGIGELNKLETLIITDNFELKGLPRNFSNLKNLKHLDLSLCFMNHFPVVICELENLEFLNVMKTGIRHLPKEIKKLKNLKTLYLNNNPLKRIPKELGDLIKLEKLWLFNIDALTIPDSFSQLKELKYLAIYGTKQYLANLKKMLPNTEIGTTPK